MLEICFKRLLLSQHLKEDIILLQFYVSSPSLSCCFFCCFLSSVSLCVGNQEMALLRQQLSLSAVLAAWVHCQIPSSLLHPMDVSPELCFDVSSDLQLSSIRSSQNRHLSIHMHQGTPPPPPPLLPLICRHFLSQLCHSQF